MSKRLILASCSPRRKALFKLITEDFDIISLDVDETTMETDPIKLVTSLAEKKANATASTLADDCAILGADTIVVKDGKVLGKPKDKADAVHMLSMLQNSTHYVYTGYCIIDKTSGKQITDYERTKVVFNAMTDDEIVNYVATGEPMDKAGAYGIQGYGAQFISGITGDYFTVMGFPVSKIYQALKKLNLI